MKGPLALVVAILAGALSAPAEEPLRLRGGFGRQAPTPMPSPRPTPWPTPTPWAGTFQPVRTAAPTPTAVAPHAASPVPAQPPLATASPAHAPAVRTPAPTAGAIKASPTRPAAAPSAPRPAVPRARPKPARAAADVSVGYVLVPFVVTDRKGRPVAGLKEKDVTLLADGVPVAYDLFQGSSDAPVSYAILLDGSGSMGLAGKMEGARAALRALAAARVPGDDFALYVFAEGEVKEVVPFTEDARAILAAADEVKPWGKTAFRDALALMPEKSLQGKNGSRAIVLLSDGIDNDSELSDEELGSLMEGIEVPVFPLGIRSPGGIAEPPPGQTLEWSLNVAVLSRIARITGGRMAIVDDPALLPEKVLDIQKDLRSQYLVGFSPTGTGPVRYRRLTLRVAGPARPVRVRAGYRGSDPPAFGPHRPGAK
ncbi:MAG TPA: VWA domain-containing protein [Thermoanaerobaculia bacterium]|nr:VWA domain-containing protein [Thermoanaerobaculia bacterium]